MVYLVALSGAVGSGKSTAARAVLSAVRGVRLSTREMILQRKQVASERGALQRAGDELDVETDFRWIAEGVALADLSEVDVLVIDAVRRIEQVQHLREAFPGRVRHVHLSASRETLEARHLARVHDVVEPGTYTQVGENSTEAAVDDLAAYADVAFDASRLDEASVAAVALAGLGLVSRTVVPLVDVIVGGQFGSEGKGNVCSYLADRYQVLVRVGGPNAGHRVRDPDYDFVHIPSGALHNPTARLLIGAGATLSLDVLMREIREIGVGADWLSVDPQAIIIEESDLELEAGSLEVIGSTKKGVGVATARKIVRRGDAIAFGAPVRLARDVPELAPFVRSVWVELERAYARGDMVMLEGTQGTDLSLHHGMWPHVTSRETTASGCMADAGVAPDRVRRIIMVVRTYPIRVGGTSGYMGRPVDAGAIAERSRLDVLAIQNTEVGTVSRKPRRIAEFDLGQVRRAAALNGATEIAVTFADYISASNVHAGSYEDLTSETRDFVLRVEQVTGQPVAMISSGPHRTNMIERVRT